MPSAVSASELAIAPFVHEIPSVRVVFGTGSIEQVAPDVDRLGGTVLLSAGRGQAMTADRVAAELSRRCIGRTNEVVEHVPAEFAQHAVEVARATAAITVVCPA